MTTTLIFHLLSYYLLFQQTSCTLIHLHVNKTTLKNCFTVLFTLNSFKLTVCYYGRHRQDCHICCWYSSKTWCRVEAMSSTCPRPYTWISAADSQSYQRTWWLHGTQDPCLCGWHSRTWWYPYVTGRRTHRCRDTRKSLRYDSETCSALGVRTAIRYVTYYYL